MSQDDDEPMGLMDMIFESEVFTVSLNEVCGDNYETIVAIAKNMTTLMLGHKNGVGFLAMVVAMREHLTESDDHQRAVMMSSFARLVMNDAGDEDDEDDEPERSR